MSYFNVRWKADVGRLNPPHGTRKKVKKEKNKNDNNVYAQK